MAFTTTTAILPNCRPTCPTISWGQTAAFLDAPQISTLGQSSISLTRHILVDELDHGVLSPQSLKKVERQDLFSNENNLLEL